MSHVDKKCEQARKEQPSISPQWRYYPVTMENWVQALEEEERSDNQLSFAEIARRIGYARPSLSLAKSGRYIGRTDKIAKAYIDYRNQVRCPYRNELVSRGYCADMTGGGVPTHNPSALRHFRACQGCEHKPMGDTK